MYDQGKAKGWGRVLLAGLLWAAALGAEETAPGYRVTVASGSARAINYRYLSGATTLGFRGTVLLPEAQGSVKVRTHEGGTRLKATFHHLEPASRFGGEYMTYVLWAVSPAGRPSNLGELVVRRNGKARLEATTHLQTFALVVTAEPHFAVTKVSDLVVLENAVTRDTRGHVEEVEARYELLPRGTYVLNGNPGALQAPPRDPKVSPYYPQAMNALRIAQGEQAADYAPFEYQRAEELMRQLEEDPHKQRKPAVSLARQVIQVAEDARLVAEKKQEEVRLAQDKRAAEEAQQRAEAAQHQAEEARAAMETLRTQAAQESAQAKHRASQLAREVSAEKLALRKKLRDQLDKLFTTQDTEQGIIATMSEVLFPSGKAVLQPGAREKQAKVAGILLAYPGLKINVIGHTDATGQPAFNQTLSRRRAAVVRNYLTRQGIPPDSVQSEGVADSRPVDSNDTPAGRARNRRVELVITGEPIGF